MMNLSLTYRLSQALPSGSSILDLGCGTGRHALDLARAGFGVAGLDGDVDALETARSLAEAGACPAFVAGDARALPFRTASLDAVLCVDVLHWSADARAFAAAWSEALRVLRPGGLFGARLRALEAAPAAALLGDGRHRLENGAEWVLARREDLGAGEPKVEWVEAPVLDGDSWRFILRKTQ